MYLLVIHNNVHLLQVEARPQLQSQQQLNKALLTYVIFTVIVTARYNEDMSESSVYYTMCTVGDLLYRTLCWLSMKSLIKKMETRRDDEEEEEERFTVPAKQEKMYNPRKEMFCYGELY